MFLEGYGLVEKYHGEMVVSHRVIAEHTETKQISIRKLIDKFYEDFEYFGQLSFKMTTVKNTVGAVNKQKTYYLNEHQATLLFTYLKNSSTMRGFKMALVEEFYRMRDSILWNLKHTKGGKNSE